MLYIKFYNHQLSILKILNIVIIKLTAADNFIFHNKKINLCR